MLLFPYLWQRLGTFFSLRPIFPPGQPFGDHISAMEKSRAMHLNFTYVPWVSTYAHIPLCIVQPRKQVGSSEFKDTFQLATIMDNMEALQHSPEVCSQLLYSCLMGGRGHRERLLWCEGTRGSLELALPVCLHHTNLAVSPLPLYLLEMVIPALDSMTGNGESPF